MVSPLITRGPRRCLSLLLLCCLARASSSFLQPAPLPLTPTRREGNGNQQKEASLHVSVSPVLHPSSRPSLPLLSLSSSLPYPDHQKPTLLSRVRGGTAVAKGAWDKARVWVFIGLWYYFNVYFNISNKKVLNVFPMPWSVSVAQLGVGALYALAGWAVKLRRVPQVHSDETKTVGVLSLFHAISHITAITSLMAGAVSFTHIVKSAEPFFSALFAGLFFKQFFHPLVYAALVPVVGGVAYASVKELTFTWLSFSCAMASNVVCAARGVVVKGMMGGGPKKSQDLGSSNLYALLTIQAVLMLLPFAIILEGPQLLSAWSKGAALMPGGGHMLGRELAFSGLTFYLYNEVAFAALESLHPISHAVVNTIKRVVIIVVSVLVFRNPMTSQSIAGSGIAVLGVLLYSLAKHYCPSPKPKDT